MGDLADVRDDERQEGVLVEVALAAVKVYKGASLSFNAAGYADVGDAGETFAGIAVETVDNSAGSAGDKTVRVWRSGIVSRACSGAVQANVGNNAYISDDQTVTFAGGIAMGVVVGLVSATKVRVDIGRVNAATIPAGGTTDQVLAKNSGTDFDLKWKTDATA